MKSAESDTVDLKEFDINTDRGFQREIRLNNILTSINTIFILLLFAIPSIRSQATFVFDIIVSTILGVIVLLLNKMGKYYYARFISNVFFLPLHFFAILFAEELFPFMYDIFSYAILAYLIYPIFTLDYTKEKRVFILAILINLILLVVHEMAFSAYKSDYQIDNQLFMIFKAFQVITWIMIAVISFTSKMINIKSEAKMKEINKELHKLNLQNNENLKEIAILNEEIVAQNEELITKQEQLSIKNIYIEEQNTKLKEYQQKLEAQLYEITITQTKLENKEAVNKSILSTIRQNFNSTEFDLKGNILHISPIISEYLHTDSHSLKNKNIGEIFDKYIVYPKKWDFYNEWQYILNGELKSQNFIFKFDAGEVHVRSHYSPIRNAKGETIMVLSIGEDITSLVNQQREIEKSNKILQAQKEKINAINNSLEIRVKERTDELEKRNAQLEEYAFINAHILRAPVSSISGLINLLHYETLPIKETDLFKHLLTSVDNLNEVVQQINTAIEQNTEMNRKHFNK
ncbi:hypothetical protein [Chondrinema litorale]|uniref:hypothetical protein n=1 Tax=Chondrinema litorale TaxID=2994555 RepID=UPI002542D65D|nr:hypothetical protein [Chondrinema litorale]UZR98712.1 hypothetical protein OQ292_32400 [Chondrinema litorale]